MEKMRMESMDIIQQNIERIANIFPNCVTEIKGKDGVLQRMINFNILRQMLSTEVVDGNEAYEFSWVGKRASILEANKPIRKTLRPCVEESLNWNTTENIYIEGDNLEVLKLLQESYLEAVKMIYIDPPYNTGNDFVYFDDFHRTSNEWEEEIGVVDENGNKLFKNTDSNGRFHSDWCSMMYSRLLVARSLLSRDGVMFISIDENEVDNLLKIGKEVFGEKNYINALKWKRKKQPSFLSRHIAPVMEYILIFAKDSSTLGKLSIEKVSDATKKVINISNPLSERFFKAGVEVKGMQDGVIPKGVYTIKTMTVEYKSDVFVREGKTTNDVTVIAKFLNTQDKIDEFIDQGLLFITANKGLRRYVSAAESDKEKSITDLLLDWGDNQDSEKEQIELFGNKYFDYTKPVMLLYNLVKSCTEEEDIIMDFFSGSATTAHAVMKLNAEDEGKRKFIMVQLQEKTDRNSDAYQAGYRTICDIGKERIKRSGKKVVEQYGMLPNSLDTGFRVFKLDETNMKDVYYSADEYSQADLISMISNIKDDRTDLDLLFSCVLEWGIPLSLPYTSEIIEGCTVHNYNNGDLIACFDESVSDNVVKTIARRQPLRAVFRDSSFVDSPSKINVGEIFKLLAPDTRLKVI